jgi:selenocysteine lyase/cysteine desulfurase
MDTNKNNENALAFTALENGMLTALETYSNVHRGSGHNSMVTTHLFEQAREIVLEYLGLNKGKFVVVFCAPQGLTTLIKKLEPKSFQLISSQDFGLSLGACAMAVKRKVLSKVAPLQTGGGTARLIAKDWVVWAKGADKFEAGTPAIINVIAFAKALRMIRHSGKDIFRNQDTEKLTVTDILYHDELEKFSGRELLNELRKTLIGCGLQVPTLKGIQTFINLDNSASTRTFMPIWNAFRQTLRQPEHVKLEVIQEVKSICSGVLGAPADAYDVIYTSNATEAINLAAQSFSRESEEGTEPVVLNTLLEHSSNDLPWRMVPGCSVVRLSMDSEGFIDLKELESIMNAYNNDGQYGNKRIRLVAVSGASNVLGACNNLKEISRIAHRFGIHLLVDGTQLVAHRKVAIEECGIDYFVFSAHKVYAPFGTGALVARKGLLHFNAKELEEIQSSGEENAGGIAALGKALSLLNRIGMDLIEKEEQILTRKVLNGMSQITGLDIYGIKDPDSPRFSNKIGVIPFALKNKMATQVGKELALNGGIGVRSGCHCAHITVKQILHVGPGLEKFQKLIVTLFPQLSLPGVVRVSLGIENCGADVDALIKALGTIADKTQNSSKKEVKQQIKDFVQTSAERVFN